MENKEIKSNNGIIIGVMAFIIIVLAGLCIYLLFIKKDEGVVDNNNQNNVVDSGNDNYTNNNNQHRNEKIEIIKHVNSYVGDLYLDSDGKCYFSLSNNVGNNANLKSIKNKQVRYTNIEKNSNYQSDYLDAISFDNMYEDINYVKDGQAGYGYFILYAPGTGLYLISDEAIEQDGSLELMLPNVLKRINYSSVGSESSQDGVISYVIDNNNNKIYLHDAVLNDIKGIELTESSQTVFFNNKNINMKFVTNNGSKGDLFIDDKKIATFDYNHLIVYVTNKFIAISWPGAQCGELIVGYINEENKFLESNDFIENLHYENGKVIGMLSYDNEYDLCAGRKKVEIIYAKNSVTTKDVK